MSMWVLVVYNEDTDEVHVYGGPEGPWPTEEHGITQAEQFIVDAPGDTSNLKMTVTNIMKFA